MHADDFNAITTCALDDQIVDSDELADIRDDHDGDRAAIVAALVERATSNPVEPGSPAAQFLATVTDILGVAAC